MIEANINESFPVSVTLLDEESAQLISGQIVTYSISTIDDLILSPPVSGTLTESTIENGIYKTTISLPDAGYYICYAKADGFFAGAETIFIKAESCIDTSKYSLPHNISVLDVQRTSVSGTASQLNRKVPMNCTDYIVTLVKRDTDLDWSSPVASGINYAWYRSEASSLPYMMGAEY